MSILVELLRSVRLLHRYLGAFAAPALLFFAFTGALQTLSLHEASKDGTYHPPAWLASVAQLHKKQTLQVQPKKPKHDEDPTAQPGDESDHKLAKDDAGTKERPSKKNTAPMKVFFGLVSVALMLSTITGLQTAWAYTRHRRAVVFTVLAGIIVPIALLFV